MLVELVMVAGVLGLPLPALVLGARGLRRHDGFSSEFAADRASLVVLMTLRVVTLVLLLALSGLTLLSAIGAMIKGVQLPSMVWVLFVLDLLLGALTLLTFGRRDRRPVRRRANPAAR